jgi:hypothetical protein
MYPSSIPNSTVTFASKWTTTPLKFSVYHLVVAMASKQREVFDLNTAVKVIEVSG